MKVNPRFIRKRYRDPNAFVGAVKIDMGPGTRCQKACKAWAKEESARNPSNPCQNNTLAWLRG